MIVGSCFDGDDDNQTSWEQHDVYRQALRLIVGRCRAHVEFAVSLLGLRWPKRWTTDFSYDHRTLQRAHDLLAAAWRYRTHSIQFVLSFDGRPNTEEIRMQAWLQWLEAEIASWQSEPRLVGLVMTILAEQNTESGYQAEEELADLIVQRFQDIPWRKAAVPEAGRYPMVQDATPLDGKENHAACTGPAAGRPACNTTPGSTSSQSPDREG